MLICVMFQGRIEKLFKLISLNYIQFIANLFFCLFVFMFVFSIFSSFFFFFKKYGKVQMVERLFFFSSSQNILLFSFWIIYIRVRHSKGLSFVLSFFSMRLLKLDYFPKGLFGGICAKINRLEISFLKVNLRNREQNFWNIF